MKKIVPVGFGRDAVTKKWCHPLTITSVIQAVSQIKPDEHDYSFDYHTTFMAALLWYRTMFIHPKTRLLSTSLFDLFEEHKIDFKRYELFRNAIFPEYGAGIELDTTYILNIENEEALRWAFRHKIEYRAATTKEIKKVVADTFERLFSRKI